MPDFVSHRHKLKFYLSVIGGSLFFLALGTLLLMVFLDVLEKPELKTKEYLMPVFIIGTYFMAFYTVYCYRRNAPVIKIENQQIYFNKEAFLLSEIKKIEFTGKKVFKYLMGFPMEAATLRFENGQTKHIFDDMYENTWELKSYLQQVVIEGRAEALLETRPILSDELEYEQFDTFKGNQFTSLRGLTLWPIVGMFVYMLFQGNPIHIIGKIFIILFILFWFFLHSWLMHYFMVSPSYFLVKNHNLFWQTKAYRLSEIKEIVFETQGKMPNCLRVITKDFKSKLYPAGTLRDKTWLELKKKLKSLKIKVRNECIF